jgi:actin-related protein
MLYSEVVVSGGNTMFSGFAKRLRKELKSLAPSATNVKVVAPTNRMHSAWVGGTLLGSVSTVFANLCISKTQYEETGRGFL